MRIERGLLSVTWLISLVAFGIILSVVVIQFASPPRKEFFVGKVTQYPPAGRPYQIEVEDKVLYLANTGDEILIFHWQTPASTHCRYRWWDLSPGEFPGLKEAGAFIDPCSGARFSLDGSYVFGPAHRGLDRYPVRLEGDQIFVVLSETIKGQTHP